MAQKPLPAYEGNESYVFVSYSHEDADGVYPEIRWLQDQGFNVWYDEGISGASRWRDAIASRLGGCHLLLFYVSPRSVESQVCREELEFALDGQRPVLSVHLEPTLLPDGIRLAVANRQALFRQELEPDDYERKLLSAVATYLDQPIPAVQELPSRPSRNPTVSRRYAAILAVTCSLLVGGVTTSVVWLSIASGRTESDATEDTTLRFPIGVPVGTKVALDEPAGVHLTISPDGRRVAFAATRDGKRELYVRDMDETQGRPIAGTEGAEQPFFSPDGTWIGFVAGRRLFKVAVAAGTPILIAEVAAVVGASWGPNDRIVLGVFGSGLQSVSASGGNLSPATRVDSTQGDRAHVFPQILRGGTHVLYTVRGDSSRIEVAPLNGGEPKIIQSGSRAAKYIETGHLLYPQADGLMAVPFDLETLEVGNSAVLVVENVYTKSTVGVNNAAFAVSETGVLVYQAGTLRHRLAWLEQGKAAEIWSDPRWGYWYSDVSSDGRVATTIAVEAANIDIWVFGAGPPLRVTADGTSLVPRWTPNGEKLAFVKSENGNMYWKSPHSDEPAELLLDRPGIQFPSSWHPDGQRLAFFEDNRKSGQNIWELDVDAGTVRELVVTRFNEAHPQYSPDGKWLAFASDRSGIREVWLMKLPNGTPRQLTIGGGSGPKWSPDGRSFFYTDGNRIWRTSVPESGTLSVDAAKHLPDGRYLLGFGEVGPNHYSIAPDGRVVVSVIDKLEQEPVVVWNWFSEMERLFQN